MVTLNQFSGSVSRRKKNTKGSTGSHGFFLSRWGYSVSYCLNSEREGDKVLLSGQNYVALTGSVKINSNPLATVVVPLYDMAGTVYLDGSS